MKTSPESFGANEVAEANVIDDKMFFYNKSEGAYQPLDIQLYNEVMQMRCNL